MPWEAWLERLDVEPWLPLVATALRILGILLAACIAARVLQRAISAFRERAAARMTDSNARQRAETLGRAGRYVVAVLVGGVALMLVLAELRISLAPILGASGVIGLAIGFGSQSLVKDYFSGLFILLEDQIRKGDVVRVASLDGLVEDVTLRHVRLRDYDGNVHFIPNNLITTVTNMSRNFAYAVIDLPLAFDADVDRALDLLRDRAEALCRDDTFGARILAPVEMVGVDRWEGQGVVIRCRFKVLPLEQWNVKREFLRRMQRAFTREGYDLPWPQVTLRTAGGPEGPTQSAGPREREALAPASSRA